MKILLVEDDELSGLVLSEALTTHHYSVNLATDGQTGLALAQALEYDLILLDVLIPKLDGISLCRKLRSQGYQKPILLLTGNDSNRDRITGLDAGADDYVSKPYELDELMARIRALLRRAKEPIAPDLSWDNLRLNPVSGEVTCGETPLSLTPKEYGLLELFLRNPQRVFSRSDILDRIWSLSDAPGESAVTTHIKDLRHKLKAAGVNTDIIETVYGFGYRLKSPPEKEPPTHPQGTKSADKDTSDSDHSTSDRSTDRALLQKQDSAPSSSKEATSIRDLLEHFKDTFAAQVNVLEQAATALLQASLDPELRQRARLEAHKLSGSLGLFGFPEGSMLAHQVEQLLLTTAPLGEIEAVQLSQWVKALQQRLAEPPVLSPQSSPSVITAATRERKPVGARSSPSAVPLPSDRLLESPSTNPATILTIDRDITFVEQLETQAAAWGMRIITAPHPTMAKAAIAQTQPAAVLLNFDLFDAAEDGLLLLTELAAQRPTIPVLVMTDRDSLADRVTISRLGGQGFLRKPVSTDQVFNTLAQLLPQIQSEEAKVMVVDDDPTVLASLCQLLQPWGVQTIGLGDPQQFWNILTTVIPDLLVLDLEMPNFSGIDLCRVVRHDAQWGDLPILVVTAHTDTEVIQQVFAAGADDFIRKPVIEPEFVTRILSRLERVRLQRRLKATYG